MVLFVVIFVLLFYMNTDKMLHREEDESRNSPGMVNDGLLHLNNRRELLLISVLYLRKYAVLGCSDLLG